MTSFQIAISPSKRAAGRFISHVRRALQRALVEGEAKGINQSRIAEAIGIHRSVISRELNGRQDITLGRVAELAWAMGQEIKFDLNAIENDIGSNTFARIPSVSHTPSFHTAVGTTALSVSSGDQIDRLEATNYHPVAAQSSATA